MTRPRMFNPGKIGLRLHGPLLDAVDEACSRALQSRSEFTRAALREALERRGLWPPRTSTEERSDDRAA